MKKNFEDRKNDIKSKVDIVSIIGQYTKLESRGNKYVGLCPFHEEKTPSFNVIPDDNGGYYHCFGCNESGDVISFIEKKENLSFIKALDFLDNGTKGSTTTSTTNKIVKEKPKSKKSGWTFCYDISMSDEEQMRKIPSIPENYRHYLEYKDTDGNIRNLNEYGPHTIYPYSNANGYVNFYVYRYERNSKNKFPNKKYPMPLSLWKDENNRYCWKPWGIEKDTPLYGLYTLKKYPNKKVLVVSGEKCVDACRKQFKEKYGDDLNNWNYIPTTWIGGDSNKQKADFSPLIGREIVYWADNDYHKSGQNAMQEIANIYPGTMLNIELDKYTNGWDCADAADAGIDIEEFITNNVPVEYGDSDVIAPTETFINFSNKKILATEANFRRLLQYYGYHIWYNTIIKKVECSIKGKKFDKFDNLNSFYTKVTSLCNLNGIADKNTKGYINMLAAENVVNPVMKWISSRKWDGKSRFAELCDSIICDSDKIDIKLKNLLVRKWFISAVAAAYRQDGDNFWCKGILVLQGEQSVGKTTFLRSLVGTKYGGNLEWFGEGLSLDATNKDSKRESTKHWITEFGELESTTKKSMAELKAFIGKGWDEMRIEYAPNFTTHYRRTVFCGSVNQDAFLSDFTGNVRFWCLPVLEFKNIEHLDMQQVWSEVKQWYDSGENWWLTPEEEKTLSKDNAKYEYRHPVEDLIEKALNWDCDDEDDWQKDVTITEILLHLGWQKPQPRENQIVSAYLRKRLGNHNVRIGSGNVRFWRIPPYKKSDFGGFYDSDNVYRGGF